MVPHEGKWEGWQEVDKWKAFMKKLSVDILNPRWSFGQHLKNFYSVVSKITKAAKILGKTSLNAPPAVLVRNYDNFCKAHLDYGPYIWVPWAITIYFEDWFINQLKRRFDDWEDIYEKVASISHPIQTQKMIEEVWRWKLSNGKPEGLGKIARKYNYLSLYSYNFKPWTRKEILRQAQPLSQAKKRLREAQEFRRSNRLNFIRVYKRLKRADPKLAKAAYVIHNYVWLRTERIDMYKYPKQFAQPFYRNLEKRFRWKYGWSLHLTYDEMMKTLREGKCPISIKELEKRHKNFYVGYITSKKSVLTSDLKQREKFLEKTLGKN